MLTKRVSMQLEFLTRAQRKQPTEQIASLVASRICHGWAFTGQSRQDHEREVIEIKHEVYSQLGIPISQKTI